MILNIFVYKWLTDRLQDFQDILFATKNLSLYIISIKKIKDSVQHKDAEELWKLFVWTRSL